MFNALQVSSCVFNKARTVLLVIIIDLFCFANGLSVAVIGRGRGQIKTIDKDDIKPVSNLSLCET